MNWKNVLKDGQPVNNQDVLLSIEGINYVATYNEKDFGFQVKDNGKFISIKSNAQTIYWTEIKQPYTSA